MKAAVEGPEVTYAEAFPSTDLVYVPTATGFKELVVLRGGPRRAHAGLRDHRHLSTQGLLRSVSEPFTLQLIG